MRRTFFSFHYQPDVTRAFVVRNSWVSRPEDQKANGFFDFSVFEASRRNSPDALKRFLREGLENTSVTCVLAGSNTANRRWVRYEIARSLVRRNGLLTVFIHSIKNMDLRTAAKGTDPLSVMGVYKVNGEIYLCEQVATGWRKYQDYTLAIPTNDLWFPAPKSNQVIRLSDHCLAYDYVAQRGFQNIGGWIETAAGLAGR